MWRTLMDTELKQYLNSLKKRDILDLFEDEEALADINYYIKQYNNSEKERTHFDNILFMELNFNNLDNRWKVFFDALNKDNPVGLNKVSNILKKNNLKSIYIKDPYEIIMYLCLKNNDENLKYKLNILDYANLINACLGDHDENIATISYEFKTVRSLKNYLDNNSLQNGITNRMQTRMTTLNLKNKIVKHSFANLSKETTYIYIKNIFEEYINAYNIESSSTQYYFAKYAYYFLISQIAEFIDLLRLCSQFKAEQLFKLLEERIYSSWGNEKNIYNKYLKVNRSKIFNEFDNNYGEYYLFHELVNDEISYSDYNLKSENGRKSAFLTKLHKNLCIYGTINKDDTSPNMLGLFQYKDTLNLSYIEHLVSLFDCKKKNKKIWKWVNNITVNDFLDFKISWEKFYDLIFSFGKDKLSERAYKRKLQPIVQGTYDFNRTTFIYYLMVLNHAINWENEYVKSITNDMDKLFVEKDGLNIRINRILLRCGYNSININGDNIIDIIVWKGLLCSNYDFYNNFNSFLNDYKDTFHMILIEPIFEKYKLNTKRKMIRKELNRIITET